MEILVGPFDLIRDLKFCYLTNCLASGPLRSPLADYHVSQGATLGQYHGADVPTHRGAHAYVQGTENGRKPNARRGPAKEN